MSTKRVGPPLKSYPFMNHLFIICFMGVGVRTQKEAERKQPEPRFVSKPPEFRTVTTALQNLVAPSQALSFLAF